jgi:ribonuclease J
LDRSPAAVFVDRQPLHIDPFSVTPFLVDHSAFDSYALLVQVDDRRLFYTGDLRAHGRKAATFERLVDDPPRRVNTLLLEGATVGRATDDASTPQSEDEVQKHCAELFRDTPGMALACYSPQNVDRLVTVFKATIRSGRNLVMDLYGAAIAAATGRGSISPSRLGSHPGLRSAVPAGARQEAEAFWRVNDLGASRIYAEELATDPSRWVMSFRSSMTREMERSGCLREARAVWLMWPGYLDGESGKRTREPFKRLGIEMTIAHASGHATVEDLQRLATAIDADKVVPIHTDAPQRFASLFERVEAHLDGEWWGV